MKLMTFQELANHLGEREAFTFADPFNRCVLREIFDSASSEYKSVNHSHRIKNLGRILKLGCLTIWQLREPFADYMIHKGYSQHEADSRFDGAICELLSAILWTRPVGGSEAGWFVATPNLVSLSQRRKRRKQA